MLELSAQQLARLDVLEEAHYVDGVRREIVAEDPAKGEDASLQARLEAAYRHALGLGFTDSVAITEFLCYEAVAPRFHAHPAVDRWLRRPGLPVEQRFTDLLQALTARGETP
jgi:hypothetical protein